jgi:predicted translin family RNA/ssDNA-binding protein
MAANIVNSPLAIQSSIALVKAFIEARKILGELAELKRRQSDIERRMFSGFAGLEQELQEIRFLISALQEPEVKKKGKLGF